MCTGNQEDGTSLANYCLGPQTLFGYSPIRGWASAEGSQVWAQVVTSAVQKPQLSMREPDKDLLEAEALRVFQSLLHAPLQGGLVLHCRQTLPSRQLIDSYITNVSAIMICLMSVATRKELHPKSFASGCRMLTETNCTCDFDLMHSNLTT